MGRELWRAAALPVALVALFVALGGSVYAATKIDGKQIKVKSLPGNRLKPGSVPGNRLKPGAIAGNRLEPGSITGSQIDAATLGQVPTAVHADSATTARDAETALSAVNAANARTVNGYQAGCDSGQRLFAGACWDEAHVETPRTATVAAAACSARGGELPEALALAAFAQQPGIQLAAGDEWSGDVSGYTSLNAYSVATVTPEGGVDSAHWSETRKHRCVTPLLG